MSRRVLRVGVGREGQEALSSRWSRTCFWRHHAASAAARARASTSSASSGRAKEGHTGSSPEAGARSESVAPTLWLAVTDDLVGGGINRRAPVIVLGEPAVSE